jgi:hypothetical protein
MNFCLAVTAIMTYIGSGQRQHFIELGFDQTHERFAGGRGRTPSEHVCTEGATMAGMPEIIGDRQDTCPDPAENVEQEEQFEEEEHNWAKEHLPEPGACESPLRMRLHDFGCEGERAPPE